DADNVIVMVPAEHRLVTGLPLGHVDPMDEPRLDQPGEGPVEGGGSHLPPPSAEMRQEVVRGEMPPDRKNLVEDGPAGAGHLEAMGGKVACESTHGIHGCSPGKLIIILKIWRRIIIGRRRSAVKPTVSAGAGARHGFRGREE